MLWWHFIKRRGTNQTPLHRSRCHSLRTLTSLLLNIEHSLPDHQTGKLQRRVKNYELWRQFYEGTVSLIANHDCWSNRELAAWSSNPENMPQIEGCHAPRWSGGLAMHMAVKMKRMAYIVVAKEKHKLRESLYFIPRSLRERQYSLLTWEPTPKTKSINARARQRQIFPRIRIWYLFRNFL